MTFEEARAAFPVLKRYAYLNAGSIGPMAQPTYDAIVEAGKAELGARGSHDHFEHIIEARGELRRLIAGEIAVEPERIALMTSTSEGCRVVVAGLGLGPDDEIVTTDAEHFGMLGPLHASGARVRVAGVRNRPAAEALDAILAEAGPKTKLVAVSHVLWLNGQLIPIKELSDAISAPLLVDGAQTVGAIPVEAEPYDFYTVSGQKWLCGPSPTGGLYVRDPDSLRIAWPSYFSQASHEPDGAFAPRAGGARFEQSWIPAAFIAGLETAIGLAPDWRFERAREMTDLCRVRLLEEGFDVVTEAGHGTLVSLRWPGDTTEAVKRLYEQDVVIRDLPGTRLLRASCGYWTNEDDLTRLVAALERSAR